MYITCYIIFAGTIVQSIYVGKIFLNLQLVVGDIAHISQSTISRIISHVSILLASNINRYIRIPISNQAKCENKRLFKQLGHGPAAIGLPNIDGAIDCTHMRLVHTKLQNVEKIYRNRKGYFSLNVK